jgi:hypothetical protein
VLADETQADDGGATWRLKTRVRPGPVHFSCARKDGEVTDSARVTIYSDGCFGTYGRMEPTGDGDGSFDAHCGQFFQACGRAYLCACPPDAPAAPRHRHRG